MLFRSDDCNNSSSCVQTIVVEDNVPPSIVCPPDITIHCTDPTLPPATGNATATDNCNPSPIVTFNDATLEGDCPNLLTITRTWTASDGCGNTSSCIQIIILTDNEPPSITCPPDITLQCGDSTDPDNTGEPTASDDCTAPVVDFSDETSSAGCPGEFSITRTWIATDACGNTSTCIQLITIEDETAPLLTCPVKIGRAHV